MQWCLLYVSMRQTGTTLRYPTCPGNFQCHTTCPHWQKQCLMSDFFRWLMAMFFIWLSFIPSSPNQPWDTVPGLTLVATLSHGFIPKIKQDAATFRSTAFYPLSVYLAHCIGFVIGSQATINFPWCR
jgi:hypothetical protein